MQQLFVSLCVIDEETKRYRPFDLLGTSNPKQKLIVKPFINHSTPTCDVTWEVRRKDLDGRDLPENTGGLLFTFDKPVSSVEIEYSAQENPEFTSSKDISRDASVHEAPVICMVKKSYRFFDPSRNATQNNCPGLPVARNKPVGALRSKRYFKLFQTMRELSEGGRWKQFDKNAELILSKVRGDLHVFALQEVAVCYFFRNNLQAVEETLLRSLDTLNSYDSQNRNVLVARGSATLSAIKRRQKDYIKCQEFLDVARQVMSFVDCPEVLAKLEYNQAAMLTDKARNSVQYETTSRDILDSVERCLDLRQANVEEYELLLMSIRAHICRAEYYLKSCFDQPPNAADNSVCEKDMREAFDSLYKAEKEMQKEKVGCRFEIRHKLAKADYFIRKGLYQQGSSAASDALDLADTNGMELEVFACRQRRDLCDLRRSVSPHSLSVETTFLTTHSLDDVLAEDDEEQEKPKEDDLCHGNSFIPAESCVKEKGPTTCNCPTQISALNVDKFISSVTPEPSVSQSDSTSIPVRTPSCQHFSANNCNYAIQGNNNTIIINVTH
jgi:hypothetical protein